ncbi:hypothetical protein ACFZCG_39575 [Streptomyces tanashiensis]|uniref:hypothetical protein n=1 Tax=Streptomyces tanashiensis TaxID=67367 RepID=UPI0036F0AF3D
MAQLLRRWLDEAGGLRVDDVLARLTPEQFDNGQVPSRTTVSERLAGVGLRQDFLHAIARICSADEEASLDLLDQVRVARQQARLSAEERAAARTSAQAALILSQQREIEVSDKLVRAMERAAELERERNDANQLVLVLMTMTEKLERGRQSLLRERDRLHGEAELRRVREQLERSEQQRSTAEAELEQARAERRRADELAEEAQARVRVLTEELEFLRGVGNGDGFVPPTAQPLLLSDLESEADDIDVALGKAARVRDGRAERLDRHSAEMRRDNDPDNPLTFGDGPDNPGAGSAGAGRASVRVVEAARRFQGQDGAAGALEDLLRRAGMSLSAADLLSATSLLREAGMAAEARQLLFHGIGNAQPHGVPALFAGLRAHSRDTDLYLLLSRIAREWPSSEIVEAVARLRAAVQDADAYQVLSATGRDCPTEVLMGVLDLVQDSDKAWVIDTACRERPYGDLAVLQDALQEQGKALPAAMVSRALDRRNAAASTPTAIQDRSVTKGRSATQDGSAPAEEPSAEGPSAKRTSPSPAKAAEAGKDPSDPENGPEQDAAPGPGLARQEQSDAQSKTAARRRRDDSIDPADQWVLNPETGHYELQLQPPQRQENQKPPTPRPRQRRRPRPGTR